MKRKKKEKHNMGITLIALVITIIVLLILAGVSIATLTGENGILTQAQNAKNETEEAEAQEKEELENQNSLIENIVNGITQGQDTNMELMLTITTATDNEILLNINVTNITQEIVDEYLRLNLGSIFLRSLNPYGFAVKTVRAFGYSEEEFLRFYKDCLNYILDVNLSGRTFPEALTTLLARKMLTPWTIGFVDLQSPTGNGFAVTVYNYDGDVYASDESRMLSEMGDQTFRLGNVFTNTYQEIYFGPTMQLIASAGVAETLPGCSDCPYVPYCGADPVRHYATQKDLIGKRSTSTFCQKYRGIFDYLFRRLGENDIQFEEVLWSWIGERPLEDLEMDRKTNAKFL